MCLDYKCQVTEGTLTDSVLVLQSMTAIISLKLFDRYWMVLRHTASRNKHNYSKFLVTCHHQFLTYL